jgi:hypothetical protein
VRTRLVCCEVAALLVGLGLQPADVWPTVMHR